MSQVTQAVAVQGAITDNDFSGNGIMVKLGSESYTTVTLTGTANEIQVANGNGSGTPTFSLPTIVDMTNKTLKIPNGPTQTTLVSGQIAIDTNVTDLTSIIRYHDGTEELGVISMPIAQFTSLTNGYVPSYNAANNEFELVELASGGDVTSSSNIGDNRVVRGDGGAKGIQESPLEISDTGDLSGMDNLTFNTSPTPLTSEGSIYWDSTDHALAIKNDVSAVTMKVGQESFIRVYNNSGSQIDNGSVVYASGGEGVEGRLTIALADASTAETSQVIGLATHDIPDSTFGYVCQFGNVNDLDTSAFTSGDRVYLSTTPGVFTGTPPVSPNYEVFLGYIAVADASAGRIFITTIGNTSGGSVAGVSESQVLSCRKGSAGTINRGQPVYISGYNVGADEFEVELADANGTGTYPAVGLTDATITNSSSGNVVLSGRINALNTASYSVGDALYLSETAGQLTSTRPTAITSQVQRIGTVARSNASNGVILVQGAGRTNDVPNEIMVVDLERPTIESDCLQMIDGDVTWYNRNKLYTAHAVGATTAASGAGALATQGTRNFRYLTTELRTGSTSTGAASVTYANGFGGYTWQSPVETYNVIVSMSFSLNDLSTASEEFEFQLGQHARSATSTSQTDGAYFLYDRATYGDHNLRCITRNGGTAEVNDSGYAVTADTTINCDMKYIVVSNTLTQVDFFINGSLVASNTTFFYTNAGNNAITYVIIKSVGTTNSQYNFCNLPFISRSQP